MAHVQDTMQMLAPSSAKDPSNVTITFENFLVMVTRPPWSLLLPSEVQAVLPGELSVSACGNQELIQPWCA